jgi:hypothetical protein
VDAQAAASTAEDDPLQDALLTMDAPNAAPASDPFAAASPEPMLLASEDPSEGWATPEAQQASVDDSSRPATQSPRDAHDVEGAMLLGVSEKAATVPPLALRQSAQDASPASPDANEALPSPIRLLSGTLADAMGTASAGGLFGGLELEDSAAPEEEERQPSAAPRAAPQDVASPAPAAESSAPPVRTSPPPRPNSPLTHSTSAVSPRRRGGQGAKGASRLPVSTPVRLPQHSLLPQAGHHLHATHACTVRRNHLHRVPRTHWPRNSPPAHARCPQASRRAVRATGDAPEGGCVAVAWPLSPQALKNGGADDSGAKHAGSPTAGTAEALEGLLGDAAADGESAWLRSARRHYFIISNGGRPIYTWHGAAHDAAAVSALLYSLTSLASDALGAPL